MKTLNEKEKKLQEVLNKLQVLNLQSYDQIENYEFLKSQKNQLEIEKQELENKFNKLEYENENLKLRIKQAETQRKADNYKEKKFEKKIDELNQETDSLIDELDKWQM